jgi:hypothetical protein
MRHGRHGRKHSRTREETLCVDPVRTPVFHTTDSKLFDPTQCAGLQLPGVSRAVPLTTAYHFSWPEI